tara:strand:- start:11366 stop:12514 length:1149 start_codon:yes stop_codon:yes gene_type:complete
MKIAINMFMPPNHGGFHTYNYNVLNGILKKDKKNTFYVFLNQESKELFSIPVSERIRIIYISNFFSNTILKHFWTQMVLPFKVLLLKIDVLFCPINFIPIILKISSIKNIVVIHTNLPILYPKFLKNNGIIRLFFLRYFLKTSIIFSDNVIVNSKTAKLELEAKFPSLKRKISVIYLSVDIKRFKKNQLKENFYKSEMIDVSKDKYFLSISSAAPYHKLIEVVKAFEELDKKNDHLPKLLLITKNVDNKYYLKLKGYIKTSSASQKIIQIEYVDQKFLPSIYRNSELYIFSSCCEVFGFTNLEAMSCGVPVLTAKKSAMPEICGDAAVYFNPNNYKDIAEKIDSVFKNNILKLTMIRKGFKQVQKYSWDLTCKKTLKVLLNK